MMANDEGGSCPLREPDAASVEAATAAALVVTSDCEPGIRREHSGDGVTYRRDDGQPLSGEDLERIDTLHIPPAWSDVWISERADGHLQATGRDARGRKQYRYHDRWRETRDETKYGRMAEFGEALPRIRQAVDSDLRHSSLDRSRVLALVVAVLDATLIRVGNPQYARENDSFGLTTLREEHSEVGATRVRFRFRGKSGKEREVTLDDRRIARALHRVRDLPGHELFQYLDEAGDIHVVESGDVNRYLQDAAGIAVTSKDFRTWGGSLTFALSLAEAEGSPSEAAITRAVREAASVLGNTPAVCRRAYIHPGLIELYLDGDFAEAWTKAGGREPAQERLRDEERVFLGVVRGLADRPTAAA
jgi:DNA topoisomerase-1